MSLNNIFLLPALVVLSMNFLTTSASYGIYSTLTCNKLQVASSHIATGFNQTLASGPWYVAYSAKNTTVEASLALMRYTNIPSFSNANNNVAFSEAMYKNGKCVAYFTAYSTLVSHTSGAMFSSFYNFATGKVQYDYVYTLLIDYDNYALVSDMKVDGRFVNYFIAVRGQDSIIDWTAIANKLSPLCESSDEDYKDKFVQVETDWTATCDRPITYKK